MRATLIFPPATDPRSPHLALPYLAGVLRRAGIETSMRDLDLGGLLALLRPEAIDAYRERVQSRLRGGGDALRRLAVRAEALAEDVPRALAALRHPDHFYDAHRLQAARETLFDGLDLACAAADRPIHYNLQPIRYDVDGIDPQRLADLIAATGRPADEPFRGVLAGRDLPRDWIASGPTSSASPLRTASRCCPD